MVARERFELSSAGSETHDDGVRQVARGNSRPSGERFKDALSFLRIEIDTWMISPQIVNAT